MQWLSWPVRFRAEAAERLYRWRLQRSGVGLGGYLGLRPRLVWVGPLALRQIANLFVDEVALGAGANGEFRICNPLMR
jgi:hypothetical protein